MASSSPPRRRLTRRRLLLASSILLLTIVAALTVALGIAYWLAQQPPDHWQQRNAALAQIDAQQRLEMARDFERRTASHLSRAAPIAPGANDGSSAPLRHIHLGFDEINTWFDQRLGDWLANQGRSLPPGVAEPMLAPEGEDLVLAFRLRDGGESHIASIVFNVRVDRPGVARLQVRRILAGRLPVPVDMVLNQAQAQAGAGDSENKSEGADKDQDADERTTAVGLLRGEPIDAIFPIDRQRRAQLMDVRVQPTGIDITLRIEPRGE